MKKGSLNIQLVIIDPQNDFCDIKNPMTGEDAALPVPGANDDMNRLADLIDRVGYKMSDIHVTMDSHRVIDIAHPAFWVDANRNHPDPFTVITLDDVKDGIWSARIPGYQEYVREYVEALDAGGKQQLTIWPEHCIIGTWGHNVHSRLNDSLQKWSKKHIALVDYVTKGSNFLTEHYGAVMAEVVNPKDPSTGLNQGFLETLNDADIVLVAGEALSHCVKETVTQVADNIGEEHIKKFHLLTDCMSPVPAIPDVVDFPAIGEAFLKEMEGRGMTLTTSVEFLAEKQTA